jgi:AcrR family transcriptional regulator
MDPAATTRSRPRYHHGDLRATLIEAATQIIAQTRVEDFSVADAARAVGVSTGAPYRHFADRDDLLDHVAAAGFERLHDLSQAVMDRLPKASIDRIVAGGCAYVAFGASNPGLFHLMWSATRPNRGTGVAAQTGARCYAQFIESLSVVMAANGLGHLDAKAFGTPLWAMVHGFASLLIGNAHEVEPSLSRVEEMVDTAIRAYFVGRRADSPPA